MSLDVYAWGYHVGSIPTQGDAMSKPEISQPAKTTRVADPELQALEKMGKELAKFPLPVQIRMLKYLGEKFLPNREVGVSGEPNG